MHEPLQAAETRTGNTDYRESIGWSVCQMNLSFIVPGPLHLGLFWNKQLVAFLIPEAFPKVTVVCNVVDRGQ